MNTSIAVCFTLSVADLLMKGKENNFADNRNTIIQMMEWKWDDIAQECEDFLQYKGYAGVQTSPPTENRIVEGRPWWERYQLVSYEFTTRSGTETQFREMIKRCNSVGIRIYPDTIINHTAAGPGVGTAGNYAFYEEDTYPAAGYQPSDFNENCPLYDWMDAAAVRNCRLKGLADLNQTVPHVREKLLEYMNKLIDMGVAGFRVDAAKHLWPADLEYLYSNLKNLNTKLGFPPGTRPFIFQEVPHNPPEPISKFEYTPLGRVIESQHSIEISKVFRGQDKLAHLVNWGPEWGFANSKDAVVFIDNHDTQRRNDVTLRYKEAKQYKMAVAFMIGHPYSETIRVMSSFYFNEKIDPPPADAKEDLLSPGFNPDNTCTNGFVCEHRWRQIYNMVKFKNVVHGIGLNDWWSNGDQQIAFCRGNKGFIVLTNGGDVDQTFQTCLTPGVYCDIISGGLANGICTGKIVKVGEGGWGHITLMNYEDDGVLALHAEAKITIKTEF